MSKLEVDAIEPQSGTTLTIGASGDTVNIASGATITDFTSTGIDDNATSTAITIDSSERVGIGTASPAELLNIVGSSGDAKIRFDGDISNLQNNFIGCLSYDDLTIASDESNTGAASTIQFRVDAAECMRITSAGNVGIGTTSPNSYAGQTALTINNGGVARVDLDISDTIVGTLISESTYVGLFSQGASTTLRFGTNNTERMRITSSGNVGIGTSSPDSKLRVDDTVNQTILAGVNSNASFSTNGVFLQLSRNTTNNSFYAMSYYNAGAGSYKFRVADSGNVTNTNNSYGSISDEKLKENIVDATPKLEKLKQVRIVNFNFIDDNQKQIGVIAQELENIFPSMVEESPDKDEDGKDLNTTTKQVKYSVFVPILIKALQEQQTKIEQLEARITALETTTP
jgi:hypothetical protein